MTPDFCVEALQEALGKYGKPEIFNTDQGSQFINKAGSSWATRHWKLKVNKERPLDCRRSVDPRYHCVNSLLTCRPPIEDSIWANLPEKSVRDRTDGRIEDMSAYVIQRYL